MPTPGFYVYTTPSQFTTIANDIWFRYLDSNFYTINGYKYYINVYELNQITGVVKQDLGTYENPGLPNIGNFSVSRILNTQLDYSAAFLTHSAFNPTQFNGIVASDTDGYVRYKVDYGFEWTPGKTFSSVLDVSGYYGLTFSTTHQFAVGDELFISTINTDLNGTASVTSIINSYSIELDKPFTPFPYSYGSVTFAKRYEGTSLSTYIAFSGAVNYGQESTWANDNLVFRYNSGTAPIVSGQYLTQFGGTSSQTAKKLLPKDFETLSFMLPLTYYAYALTIKLRTTVYDDQWNAITTYTYNVDDLNGLNKLILGVGPGNLYYQGIVPTILNYNNYSIRLTWTDSGNAQQTPEYYFQVDTTCSPFNNVRLMWLNRLGGFDFYNFRMNSQRNETIERKEFRIPLPPQYQTGQRGQNLLKVDTTEQWTVNTDWVTEQEYLALDDLLTSLEVYVLEQTYNQSGQPVHKIYPVVITDTSYTQKTQLTEKLFNMTLTYKLAYQKYIQSN